MTEEQEKRIMDKIDKVEGSITIYFIFTAFIIAIVAILSQL